MAESTADRARRPGMARISGAIRDVVHRCSAGLRSDGRGLGTRALRPGIPASSAWVPAEIPERARTFADSANHVTLTELRRSNGDGSSVIGQCRTVWDTRDSE